MKEELQKEIESLKAELLLALELIRLMELGYHKQKEAQEFMKKHNYKQ